MTCRFQKCPWYPDLWIRWRIDFFRVKLVFECDFEKCLSLGSLDHGSLACRDLGTIGLPDLGTSTLLHHLLILFLTSFLPPPTSFYLLLNLPSISLYLSDSQNFVTGSSGGRGWKRGGAKSGFSDKGVPVTQPQKDQMTWNFACRGLLCVTIEFWFSQVHATSIKVKPVLASKCDWPL